ncbi:MAG: SpoIIE family protein phosphatase [Oscillospiraceae bacterium]|nr:SpoIIE family protein phosphatase [Oscillospiraceae bacterium]
MKNNKSLGRKILRAMTGLVIGMLLVAGVIFALTMRRATDTLSDSNRDLNNTIGDKSMAYLIEQSQNRMLELAKEKAQIADQIFLEFQRGVCSAASVAEQIYDNPEEYSPRPVPLPDPEKDGELTIQVLYSAHTDPADPAIEAELALLGNVQDTLIAVNASQDRVASLYVATESGFMVQADYIPAKKYDDAGNLMPLEAKERPWYRGAKATGAPFFTSVTRDVHTPRLAIMCGVPIFSGGSVMGVAGAGMYLDDMEDLVRSVDLGETGNACILNSRGQVLYSTYDEGTLAAVAEAEDVRLSDNKALARMSISAVGGRTGVTTLSLDGVPCYAAYAPMKTVGWTMLVFVPQEAVEAPTKSLLDNINLIMSNAFQDETSYIRSANYLLLVLFGAAVIVALAVSVALSNQIVKPIRRLTEEVTSMHGDNLDFHWDLDTGDETQMLAASFESMTERMKDYISENETITAERERISTELSLANKIQASMLPSIFPPFPNRSEFDIYAVMEPAREVGGDFYDFFLIDDSHLCLVISDVSGKGVPATLVMMISKIILQNCAMLGGSPAEILSRTNDAICSHNDEEMFVTAWVGILDLNTGMLTAANAGHEYPIIKKPDGPFELLKDKHGFVMGGFGGVVYKEYELPFPPGSKLFVYTDGVPEAMGGDGGNEMFGLARTIDALNTDPDVPPKQLLQQVRAALGDFVQDSEQFDDLTMLCVEYRGKGGCS